MNNYQISIIDDSAVGGESGKVLQHAYLKGVFAFDDMAELGWVLCQSHIAIGVYTDNYRKKENLQTINVLAFDFDNGTTAEQVHNLLMQVWGKQINHCIAGSKNHLKDKGDGKGVIERFHVFVALDRPITNHETYREMWQYFANLHFAGLNPDAACKDCSRFFARHSCVLYAFDGGSNLSLSYLERLHRLNTERNEMLAERSRKRTRASNSTPVEQFKRTKYFTMLREEMGSGSGRYRKALSIFGAMKACDLSLDDMIALFDEFTCYDGSTSFKQDHIYRWHRQM